jgi:hypothetical protein
MMTQYSKKVNGCSQKVTRRHKPDAKIFPLAVKTAKKGGKSQKKETKSHKKGGKVIKSQEKSEKG